MQGMIKTCLYSMCVVWQYEWAVWSQEADVWCEWCGPWCT